MMDIRCTVCGEPWDVDYLHEVAHERGTTFDEVWRAFRNEGCGAALHVRGCTPGDADPALSILAELMGDDIDGYASLIEDMGL